MGLITFLDTDNAASNLTKSLSLWGLYHVFNLKNNINLQQVNAKILSTLWDIFKEYLIT